MILRLVLYLNIKFGIMLQVCAMLYMGSMIMVNELLGRYDKEKQHRKINKTFQDSYSLLIAINEQI